MLVVLLILLIALWYVSVSQPGGTSFLRQTAFALGTTSLTVLDVLTGLVMIGMIAAMSGPLRLASVVMFVLWVLTLLGFARIADVPLAPLIVFVMVVGTAVHIVTYQRR